MAQKHLAPTRQEILALCPGSQSSPTEVRDWLGKYLEYRGLDPTNSVKFVWRGIELHRASHANLIDAFKQHCGALDCEAEVLARDVHTIIEGSIPPPKRTAFQVYVEALFGYEHYSSLMRWTKPNTGLLGYANCVSRWLGFLITHSILLFLCVNIVDFWMNT